MSEARGGLSPSPLETDVFPALALLGFPSKVSPISGLSNTLYHLADTLILLPHWGKKKGSSQKGKLASHLIHQLKPQLW